MSETLVPVKFEGKDIVFDVVNAGHLKVKRLDAFAARHAQRMPWLYMAFLIIVHGQVELLGGTLATTPPTSLKEFPTNKLTSQELTAHLAEMVEWHILGRGKISDEEFYLAVSKLFPVLKKSELFRAIFDSRMAGSLCARSPPVNLCKVKDLITIMCQQLYFWSCDLKHWFYQISIHENLWRLFVVRARRDSYFYFMRVLPQGWSWSPYIAQCIAWSIILYQRSTSNRCIQSQTSQLTAHQLTSLSATKVVR